MDAGNQTLLKKNNQRAIADYIIKNGPISRADLSKRLKISKPTVSANITELMDMHLLKEIGFSETDIGKKPMLVDFNKDFKYVLALDFISYITRNKISVAVCNLYCEPIFIDNIELPYSFSAGIIKNYVPEALAKLFEKNHVEVDKIGKLVLTAPTANYDEDHITFTCFNGDSINLADVFRPYFKNKIAVKNDINLAALGEKYFGVGKEADDLIFVWAGLEVGGGIILNGELHEGRDMTGGEMGLSRVYNESTGEYDTITHITGIEGIHTYIKAHKAEAEKSQISESLLDGSVYLDQMAAAAHDGDTFCQDFARCIGRAIAPIAVNLAYTMNLQMAIIGGEYTAFGDYFLNEIRTSAVHISEAPPQITTPYYTNSAMYGAFKFGADNIIASLI